jgi:hypothetical protein
MMVLLKLVLVLLLSREPLNSTVESTTRRQNGQIDGVTRSSIPARSPMSEGCVAAMSCNSPAEVFRQHEVGGY